jgi:hypothetical protein
VDTSKWSASSPGGESNGQMSNGGPNGFMGGSNGINNGINLPGNKMMNGSMTPGVLNANGLDWSANNSNIFSNRVNKKIIKNKPFISLFLKNVPATDFFEIDKPKTISCSKI